MHLCIGVPRLRRLLSRSAVVCAGLCVIFALPACDRASGPEFARKATADGLKSNVGTNDHRVTESVTSIEESAAESLEQASPQLPPEVPGKFRPDDNRPVHDLIRLSASGIHLYESKRLKLYTDLPESDARPLTALVDALYPAWEDYFGPLPPDRAGTDFQMSGYVMRDMALFRGLGLIPDDLTFDHGSHLQNEFWMREQEFEYYRRHLLIHEATHCFMTYMPGVDAPRWYLEGMAEYFGAHRVLQELTAVSDDSKTATKAEFRVMPTSAAEFPGFGRISIIRKACSQNMARTIPSVLGLKSREFISPEPYAWSWALCAFLDGTPRYRDRFRRLGAFTQSGQFAGEFFRSFEPDDRDLTTEWKIFVTNIQYGYDTSRAAIDFDVGTSLTTEETERTTEIVADRGWQSSHTLLHSGNTYTITATGRFTLTEAGGESKAWESEPQGISFRYFNGQPLGKLLGCIRPEEGPAEISDQIMMNSFPIGDELQFTAPVSGTLYLRVNDVWNSLADNRGTIKVKVCQTTSDAR